MFIIFADHSLTHVKGSLVSRDAHRLDWRPMCDDPAASRAAAGVCLCGGADAVLAADSDCANCVMPLSINII